MSKLTLHALGIIALIAALWVHDDEYWYLNETDTPADFARAYERVSK